eukprot:jgi/Botrbrau1/15637/Bobra.4_1s0022.1
MYQRCRVRELFICTLFWGVLRRGSASPVILLRSGAVSSDELGRHVSRRQLLSVEPIVAEHPAWGPLFSGRQILVAIDPPLSQQKIVDVQKEVESAGGVVVNYLPDEGLLCLASPRVAWKLRDMQHVAWVADYMANHKFGPELEPYLSDPDTGSDLHAASGSQKPAAEESAGDRFLGSVLVTQRESGDEHIVINVHFPRLHQNWVLGEGSRVVADLDAYNPGRAANHDWATPLRRRFGDDVQLWETTKDMISYSISPAILKTALHWFAQQPTVHWLSAQPKVKLHNWDASAICQSAEAPPDAPTSVTDDSGTHPFWAAGLSGAGLVVGGGDSGVDYNNCFFRDRSIDWSGNLTTDRNTGKMSFLSTVHRKFRMYRMLADGRDNNGHGTHTMGTLCGLPDDTSNVLSNNYRGMAPDAKLAFTDLGGGGSDGIFTPSDLSRSYYKQPYEVGARVHSDSWGSSSNDYEFMASEVDSFTWDHQDFLPIFAAGNEGMGLMSSNGGLTTVTSPATAKNCLTVGASRSNGHSDDIQSRFAIYTMVVSQGGAGGSQEVESYRVMQASFGGKVMSLFKKQLSLSVASPIDGCSPLENEADVNGTVVIMARGTCFFSVKVTNAEVAGAVAVLVYDNQINDFFVPATDKDTPVTIPAMAIPRVVGQLLSSAAQAGSKMTVSFKNDVPARNAWESLADFSSKGPTKDERIKPDLVAPGVLQSAYTNPQGNTCDLRYMQGTSMATPVVAGSAVLVRQYFEQGFYPTGTPMAANSFSPGGALVKAVLIGGAVG